MYKCVLLISTVSLLGLISTLNARERIGSDPPGQGSQETPGRPVAYREVPDDPPAAKAAQDDPSARSPAAQVRRGPFLSVQVNVDELGQNIVGDAANEPSMAIDPTDSNKIMIGWRQFDSVLSNFRQAGQAFSGDGGQSWTFPGVLEPGVFRSDPVLDFDAGGAFYYLSLTVDFPQLTNFRQHVFKSLDGGVSFQPPAFAFGGDKPWMAIDRTGGIGGGNIYSKWQTFFNCCGPNTFTRSTDGGLTFMDPVPVPLGPTFGTITVGPDGEVYAAGIEAVNFQNFNVIVIARSTNAKNPAVTPVFDLATQVNLGGSMRLGAGPNPAGLLGQIWVATDHSDGPSRGNVYLLASVAPPGPGPDPLDVMLARSTDGGMTWSSPVRVNDDSVNTGAWQWFGTMSVAPSGRLDAVWNDTRNDQTTTFSELFYSYSTDAGDTWSPNIPVSPPFNHFLGYPNQNKLGDYYEIISDQAGAGVAYAATFNGEQDVYFLRIEIDCNGNGIHDGDDIAAGISRDCNGDGKLDECLPCTGDCECNDLDACTADRCDAGVCSHTATTYGDVDHDDDVDLFDLFCVLNGFDGQFDNCGFVDVDIEPCPGDGDIDLFDLFAVLNAFSGIDPCCGGLP